jgi:hypothetical protein
MIEHAGRRFQLAVVGLSVVSAFVVIRDFDDYYWLNVVLATASFSGAAIGLRRLWDKANPDHRSYFTFFALLFAFWLVVWFWSADDFLPDYPVSVLVTALTCAALCMPLHWQRVWGPAGRPYAVCLILVLATVCTLFWLFQDKALHEFGYFFIPGETVACFAILALVWRFVLRRPVLWLTRNRPARGSTKPKRAAAHTRVSPRGVPGFRRLTARIARSGRRSELSCAGRLTIALLAATVALWVAGALTAGELPYYPNWWVRNVWLPLPFLLCGLLSLVSALHLVLLWTGQRSQPSAASGIGKATAISRWESIGLLYDIDELLKADKRHANYGEPARHTFMMHFEPERIRRAFLWQGDTESTLAGRARHWCIAVTPEDPAAIRAYREMFGSVMGPGLLPPSERFVLHPVDLDVSGGSFREIRREPLKSWFQVDDEGEIVLSSPIDEDVVLCRNFGHRFRLPEKLAKLVSCIHDGSLALEAISSSEPIAEVSAVFAAVEFEREGVPGTLVRFAKYYKDRQYDIYARYCVGQILPILDWSDRKVNGRSDSSDVRAAREYLTLLGYQALPKVIIRCPNGHRLRVAARKSGRVRCPECDKLGRPDAVFEPSLPT